jgi:hypothetical protein
MNHRPAAVALTGTLFLATPASALTLLLNYTHDALTDNFFATHPVARTSLERARDDIQAAITTILAPVSSDVVTGTNGITTATYDFSYSYTNPSTGAAQSILISTLAADQVTVFVGMRELTGSTLGQGGPGGTGLGVGGSGTPSQWPGAIAAANSAGTAQRMRAGGPQIGNLTGTVSLGGTPATIDVDYGSSVINLWFDIDTNNDSVTDSDATLNASWHFDWSTPVASGKNDFYSVALHELLHGLGIGTSQSWSDNVSGSNWLGPEAIAEFGTGSGLSSGGHIASVSSPRLSDGVLQQVVMAPSLTAGTRKTLTELDLAFLRDLGWQTIPEPGTPAMALAAASGLFICRRRR